MTAVRAAEQEATPPPTRHGTLTSLRNGWRIVARKELADHLSSIRFVILVVLVALAGLASVHSASGPIRDAANDATQVPSIFLFLFTLSPERVPSFHEFIAILGPLLGIAFGFDAINRERADRTLPRLVSQPIHRDDVITGKFVAGIGAIALALSAVVATVVGYGMIRMGTKPTGSDAVRLLAFMAVTIAYIGLWLALAILASVLARRAATAAFATIALWLVLTLFAGLIAGVIADTVRDVPDNPSREEVLANARLELNVRRVSPDQLYKETTGVLLNPTRQSTGILLLDEEDLAIPSALSLDDSLLLAWWQLVALIAATITLFTAAYTAFLRQEIRA
jgi:ABC-2 type transport system permease protein